MRSISSKILKTEQVLGKWRLPICSLSMILFFFFEPNNNVLQNVSRVSLYFGVVSGLRINLAKSNSAMDGIIKGLPEWQIFWDIRRLIFL